MSLAGRLVHEIARTQAPASLAAALMAHHRAGADSQSAGRRLAPLMR